MFSHSADFRVLLPRKWPISRYHYREVKFRGKNNTKYIHKNQVWTICTYIGLWFEGNKIWGHLRTVFLTTRYCYPEVRNIFLNIPAKTIIFSTIFCVVDLGHSYYRFMKITRAQKCYASVPLIRKDLQKNLFILYVLMRLLLQILMYENSHLIIYGYIGKYLHKIVYK